MSDSAAGPFRIRTVTAAADTAAPTDTAAFDAPLRFLDGARRSFRSRGYEVQLIRVATTPTSGGLAAGGRSRTLPPIAEIEALERIVADGDALLGLGPVIDGDERERPDLADWAVEVIARTTRVSFAAAVLSAGSTPARGAVRAAAEAMRAISTAAPGGEGNFRFAATAGAPAGTPFFPAAFFAEGGCFSLGLESPEILRRAVAGAECGIGNGDSEVRIERRLADALDAALEPLAEHARAIADETGWRYLGIDVSPAPGLDAGIGEVIEILTGRPFGDVSTVAACATITAALKRLAIETCGYSGLMLPVLEDRVLARRAREGRYGIAELLLYSTVCGTGLDVVPLPGDIEVAALERLITAVAVLSCRHAKPLAARLLPIPGKKAGETVRFDNPYLTDGVVMEVGA